MPRVPTLETESVRIRPLQIPLQSGSAVDVSGLARGLDVAGDALERSRLQLSQIRLSGAEAELVSRWNARLYEDEDAYFKLEGEDSVKSLDERMRELGEIQNDVMGTLTTGTEKRIFNDAMSGRHQQHRVKMSLRSFDERQAWDRATAIANVQAQLESASNDPSIENLKITKARIQEETATIARVDGAPPETQAQAAAVAVSGMYRVAIENSMITDLDHAQSLFDRFSDEIISADRKAITEDLKEHTIRQRSREESDRISAGGGSLESQLAAARRIKNTEVMDETVRRVTNRFNQNEAARSEINRDAYQALGQDLLAGTISVAGIQELQPDAWDILTQAQKEHMLAIEAAQHQVKTTNWGRWSELSLMPVNELAQVHPMDERLNLADTEFRNLVKMIEEARSGDIGFTLTSVQTPYQRLAVAAGGSKKLQTEKGQLLTRELTERLEAFEREKGAKATPDELDKMISRLIVDIEIPSRFSNIPIIGFFTPDRDRQIFQITISDVPGEDQTKITDYFQRTRGRLPTDNEIIDAYGLKLQNNGE